MYFWQFNPQFAYCRRAATSLSIKRKILPPFFNPLRKIILTFCVVSPICTESNTAWSVFAQKWREIYFSPKASSECHTLSSTPIPFTESIFSCDFIIAGDYENAFLPIGERSSQCCLLAEKQFSLSLFCIKTGIFIHLWYNSITTAYQFFMCWFSCFLYRLQVLSPIGKNRLKINGFQKSVTIFSVLYK